MQKYSVLFAGIVAVVVLETIAMLKGINGYALNGSFIAIGGMAGYWLKSIRIK